MEKNDSLYDLLIKLETIIASNRKFSNNPKDPTPSFLDLFQSNVIVQINPTKILDLNLIKQLLLEYMSKVCTCHIKIVATKIVDIISVESL